MANSQPFVPFESPFPSPRKLDLEKIPNIQNHPFDYQKEVMKSLTNYFCGNEHPDTQALGYQPGLVIMPTGSGKTLTTVTWLLDQMVKNGYNLDPDLTETRYAIAKLTANGQSVELPVVGVPGTPVGTFGIAVG